MKICKKLDKICMKISKICIEIGIICNKNNKFQKSKTGNI